MLCNSSNKHHYFPSTGVKEVTRTVGGSAPLPQGAVVWRLLLRLHPLFFAVSSGPRQQVTLPTTRLLPLLLIQPTSLRTHPRTTILIIILTRMEALLLPPRCSW